VYKRTIQLHNIHKINDSKDESIDYINNLKKYSSMVLSVKHEPRAIRGHQSQGSDRF
jgi:hypothetical protein